MLYLKQSTASQSVLIGPFVDSTDGVTAETGLTISNTDIRLSKNGANLAAKNSGGGTHDENGWYTITLDATDTDTVGRLQLHVNETGALPVFMDFQVLEENVYDAWFAASAAAGTDLASILTDTGTTLQGELDAIQAAVITNAAGADVAADIIALKAVADAVETDTQDIQTQVGTAGAGLTDLGGMSTAMKAEVNAEADTALSDYDPPTKAELDSGFSALNDPTAAAIADAVLDEALSGHTSAGSLGKAVADTETDAAAILVDTAEIGSAGAGLSAIPWNASWDAEVQSEVTDALNAYDPPTNTEMEARTLVAANYATAANLATVDANVDSVLVDTGTTLPATLATLTGGIITGTAATGTLSTTQASTDLTGYADDQLIGRTIIFTSGDCDGEATDITDYANTSGVLTFTALTTAPGNGDSFKIV